MKHILIKCSLLSDVFQAEFCWVASFDFDVLKRVEASLEIWHRKVSVTFMLIPSNLWNFSRSSLQLALAKVNKVESPERQVRKKRIQLICENR